VDRILLIEDDSGTQLLLRNRLEELGYDVVVTSTGARGLLEARAGKFDLYLCDIGLGSGIDGYEVCRRLKGMPTNHGTPVVLISGQVKSQEELHRGYEAGCESFLMKGDLTLVEDVVRAMLRIKSLKDDLGLQNRLLEEQNRRLQQERERGADLEVALRETGSRARVFRELAAGRPDGVLLVDQEGVVRSTDRGAQNIFGKDIEGKQLASLAPGTGLEAFVRDVRTDPHEDFRFDLGERSTGAVHSFTAAIIPTVPRPNVADTAFKVVMLMDANKRRVAAEMLRLEEHGVPRREFGPLIQAARLTFHPASILGESGPAVSLREAVVRATESREPALIRGEAGTGKSLVARVLHFSGPASGPFVPIHCAALAPLQLESELFGHVKGAHPEAISDRPGIFQQALHGTVFLEAVDRLPIPLQVKLLQVLEEKRVCRVGSREAEPVIVRLIASADVDLEQRVAEGSFRGDLLSHLRAHEIRTPLLSELEADVELLARHFLRRYRRNSEQTFAPQACSVLGSYEWPGNVAELESCIEQACASTRADEIQVGDLTAPLIDLDRRLGDDSIPRPPSSPAREADVVDTDPVSLELYERLAIRRALNETDGDKIAAAKLLNIGKSTFYRKLKAHGMD